MARCGEDPEPVALAAAAEQLVDHQYGFVATVAVEVAKRGIADEDPDRLWIVWVPR